MDYIIPYRPSTPDREIALKLLLQYLQGKPVKPVIVEDQNQGLFNRARLINQGVRASRSNIVWLADNDILIDPSAFTHAPVFLSRVAVYKPFFKRIYDVPLEVFEKYAGGSERSEDFPLREGLGLFSGVTAILRKTFMKLGGFDEDFVGWGSEDYALARVTFMMGYPAYSEDLAAYHFAHQKLVVDTRKHPHYQDNVTLWKTYEQASRETIVNTAYRNSMRNFL